MAKLIIRTTLGGTEVDLSGGGGPSPLMRFLKPWFHVEGLPIVGTADYAPQGRPSVNLGPVVLVVGGALLIGGVVLAVVGARSLMH